MNKLTDVLGVNTKRTQELQNLYSAISNKCKNTSSIIIEIEATKLPEREKIYLGYILGRNAGCIIDKKK